MRACFPRLPLTAALAAFLLQIPASAQRTEAELRKAIMEFVQQGTFLPTGGKEVLGDDYEAGLPFVLEVLAKPESYGEDTTNPLKIVSCPAMRAFDLLQEKDYPKALASVAAQVDSPSFMRRGIAAMLLGKIATPETVEPFRKLLRDSHAVPATFAANEIDGLFGTAFEEGGDLKWAYPLFDDLAKVHSGPAGPPATPVCALLMIDREKALPLVTTPPVLSAKNEKIHSVLYCLNDMGIPVPDKELLKTLYKAAVSGKTKDPNQAKTLLLSLALAKVPEAAKLIDAALARPRPTKEDEVYDWMEEKEAATTGFLALNGFSTDPVNFLRRQINQDPAKMAALPPNARTALHARWLWIHLWDDGDPAESLSEFLASTAPADYAPTLEALRTLKAPKAAQILADALKALGPEPLPADKEAREEALYSLDDRTRATLKKVPAALIKAERLDLLVLQWIVKNRADFPNPTPAELEAEKAAQLAAEAAEEEDE
jgi:hypothetical protein